MPSNNSAALSKLTTRKLRYVLSPSHLHEFKSHERLNDQSPVMSLFLPEQKLGSHSQPYSSSHKFMIKGRQTGTIHSRHSWVFRAESHDTMLAWYEDIKKLNEISTHAERNAFVTSHRRTLSTNSQRAGSVSSDGGMDEDEADQVPYSAGASSVTQEAKEASPQRPEPGGRFPSELQVDRALQAPLSASSEDSIRDYEVIATTGSSLGTSLPFGMGHQSYDADAIDKTGDSGQETYRAGSSAPYQETNRNDGSMYGDWMSPLRLPDPTAAEAAIAATESHQTHTPPPPQKPPQRSRRYTPGPNSRPQSGVLDSSPSPAIAVAASDSSTSARRAATTTSDRNQESRASTAPTTTNQTAEPQPRDPTNNAQTPLVSEATPASAARGSSKSITSISDLHVPGEFPPTPVAA
jgi:hypothetical protein